MAKPFTLKFGPWSPDLANVGIEVEGGAEEIPAVDCLNVFWQDSSYRCLPSLASIGPSLGTQILDAFTWYDNTQGKEVLFVATANGFFTMVDRVWTEVSTIIQEGAAGLAISLKLGTVTGLATAMSPTSQSASGTGSSFTFPAMQALIGYGTASGYNWHFAGTTGSGTWNIQSGQGTATAIPDVSFSTPGSMSTATCLCDITFGGTVYTVSGTLSYTQQALSPLLHSYTSGSGTETVPAGYANVVIEVKGGGGGSSDTGFTTSYAAGGGGAGYCRTSMAVTGGGTFNYQVGAHGGTNVNNNATPGGASSVSSGSISIITMTANGGGGGAAGGAGGTASGGNQANVTGANGVNGGVGGASTAGVNFDTGNAFGHGGTFNSGGSTGGFISFYYTQ